jgi:hypothetical protein
MLLILFPTNDILDRMIDSFLPRFEFDDPIFDVEGVPVPEVLPTGS